MNGLSFAHGVDGRLPKFLQKLWKNKTSNKGKKMRNLITAFIATTASALVFASEPAKTIGFDEVKAACLNPAQYQNQVAPTNIQVSCKDVQLKWVATTDGSVSLQTAHAVTTSVASDKYNVSPVSGVVDSAAQVFACAQFKQVSESLELVRAISCDEMVAYTGSALEFCSAAAATMRANNASAIVIADTGSTISLCPGSGAGATGK